jgi:ferric iron reductase protein FhuF
VSAGVQRGPDTERRLRACFDQVGQLVPYLRASLGRVACAAPGTFPLENAVEDGVWLSCDILVEDGEWLVRVIRACGVTIGTDDPAVSASLFVQGYAYRLLALAVASLTVSGLVPDSDPVATALHVSRGRPSNLAFDGGVFDLGCGDRTRQALNDPRLADLALRNLVETIVEHHLRPLIATVRQEVRIGERLLWGNVAASAATAFRTMEGCLGSWVRPLGDTFLDLGPREVHGQGSYLSIEEGGYAGWFWERRNCCLFDRLPQGIRCADCSLTPAAQRRAAYRASLTPAAQD